MKDPLNDPLKLIPLVERSVLMRQIKIITREYPKISFQWWWDKILRCFGKNPINYVSPEQSKMIFFSDEGNKSDLQGFKDGPWIVAWEECSFGSLVQKCESILIQKIGRDSKHVDRVPDALELAFGLLQGNE